MKEKFDEEVESLEQIKKRFEKIILLCYNTCDVFYNIINIYALSMEAPKYIKQILTDLKRNKL